MSTAYPTIPLAEACTVFADGDWIESKDQSATGIRLIQTGNVGEGVFEDRDHKARYIDDATFDRLRCTEIYEGDSLVSRLPDPVGRSCILPKSDERMITAVDCTIVRFDQQKIIPQFFNYYSQSQDYLRDVDAETTGATRKRISRGKLALVRIPRPTLEEQRRIVCILDKAFDGIATAQANTEKNLQNARAIFRSHLEAVFAGRGGNWIGKSLDRLGTTQTGTTPKTSEPGNYGEFIPFIKPSDFSQDGSLNYTKQGLSERGFRNSRPVPAGSVLMVCIGATIGKCGYSERDITTNQQINSLIPSSAIFYKFAYYQMLTEDFQRRVLAASGQATLPIINKSKWGCLEVTFPTSLEEQRKIAADLDSLSEEISHLEAILRRKLSALDALKNSILNLAFRGNL